MTSGRLYTRRRFLRAAAGALLSVNSGHLLSSCASHAPGKKRIRFVFYTDVHARTEWDTPLAMARAADAINAQRPDFVIAGGDLITDGFQNAAPTVEPRWDAYMAMHRAIEGDIYPTLGNHDLVAALPEDGSPPASDPRAVFRDKMGLERTYYAFDAGDYRFFVLDSIVVSGDEFKYHGRISEPQLEWLKQELSGIARDTPLAVVLHMPMLTTFYEATRGATSAAPPHRVLTNNTEVLELFEKHNLVLVLQGHLHVKERLWWRNTTFITGGAICARWWRGPWHGTEEGFNVITLQGNRVDWDYINYGWQSRRPSNK